MHPLRLRSSPVWCLILFTLAACADTHVTGRLVDYRTDEPIANATVTLSQRGWGRSNGHLVWDRTYTATTRTAPDGTFALSYPGPRLLARRSGSLSAEAPGWQRLTNVVVTGRDSVYLQTLPVPDVTVPGGVAQLGVREDGQLFGWNFVNDAPILNPEEADIFPVIIDRNPLLLALKAPQGGGLLFISQEEQRVVSASHGHLLRYVNEAPTGDYSQTLTLDEKTPGTVIVRTPYGRYAKIAFDPERLMTGSGRIAGIDQPVRFSVMLPFAYNPRPGRDLPFDPTGSTRINPEMAAILADLPADGKMPRIARTYRITMHDDAGRVADSLVVRLAPESPQSVKGAPRPGNPGFTYRNVRLSYGDDGLPRVQLSIEGEHFTYNSAPLLVSRRRPTVMEVHVFAPHTPAHRFELWLQEVVEP